MSQELVQVIKKFKPHKDLLELADMIRNLSSVQTTGTFTDGNVLNKRCVLGALAVEYYGSVDEWHHIEIVLCETWMEKSEFRYSVKYNDNINTGTYHISLLSKLVAMNDNGRAFDEIADWVELEAYRYGEYNETPQPKVL